MDNMEGEVSELTPELDNYKSFLPVEEDGIGLLFDNNLLLAKQCWCRTFL